MVKIEYKSGEYYEDEERFEAPFVIIRDPRLIIKGRSYEAEFEQMYPSLSIITLNGHWEIDVKEEFVSTPKQVEAELVDAVSRVINIVNGFDLEDMKKDYNELDDRLYTMLNVIDSDVPVECI